MEFLEAATSLLQLKQKKTQNKTKLDSNSKKDTTPHTISLLSLIFPIFCARNGVSVCVY
jgi:hypothetical protein